jgi:uncharacterized membrane protein
MKKITLLIFSVSLLATSCTFEKAAPLPVGCTNTMFFSTDIKPLFDTYCITCHFSGGSGPGDFSLYADIKTYSETIKYRVFVSKDMPQAGSPQLSQDDLNKLKCWLDQGAPNN